MRSRRLLLLLLGLGLFGGVFFLYSLVFGNIDGLPELPAKFLVRLQEGDLSNQNSSREILWDRLLRRAFGENCVELKYFNKLTFPPQGVVLAFEKLDIEDGRLKLSPLSLAMFGRLQQRSEFPEINTLHCDVAWLTFDRPIRSLAETNKARLIAADFVADANSSFPDKRNGWIHITHNHGTPHLGDDVGLVTRGPLRFRDDGATDGREPHVVTEALVEVTDRQVQPPHRVTAQGLRVFLSGSAVRSPRRPTPGPTRQSLVRLVELPANVQMLLTLDNANAFPGGMSVASSPQGAKPVLSVRTLGSFHYDVAASTATFEHAAAKAATSLPDHVEVVRTLPTNFSDRMRCERLELVFRRQGSPPTTADNRSSAESGIEEITATGKVVELVAEADPFQATCTRLTHHRAQRRTSLFGAPVVVQKEGHRLNAPQVDVWHHDRTALTAATEANPLTVAAARGAGVAVLEDAKTKKRARIEWTRELHLARTARLDRITISGAGRIEDMNDSQSLRGDRMELWIADDGVTTSKRDEGLASRKRLHRVRVDGNAELDSPDLQIRNSGAIACLFRDAPASLPASVLQTARTVNGPMPPPQSSRPANEPPRAKETSNRPILLKAKEIDATFLRSGPTMELDQARCTGEVHVRQEAANPKERGVEAHGHVLMLTHTPSGNILRLTGPTNRPATVVANEMTLYGTQITCNQIENRADVDGRGSMQLLLGSTLDGQRLSKPEEILVLWNERMTFNGSWASFIGSVQATHKYSEVLCPRMDVYLDRRVQFQAYEQDARRGASARENGNPAVTRIVCHCGESKALQPVTMRESVRESGRLLRFQQIEAPIVVYSNETSQIEVEGPGEVRTFQPGSSMTSDGLPMPNDASDETPASAMKLTHIRFQGRMQAHSKDRWAKFFDDVRVTHVPTENPLMPIADDRQAPKSFTLRCKQLVVRTRLEGVKQVGTMSAIGRAEIASEEFSGQADQIDYDDGKDQQVIFKSAGSALARLNHIPVRGQPPQEWLGRTILYWRKTNQFKVVEAAGGTVP